MRNEQGQNKFKTSKKMQKEAVPCNRVLIITKPFSISVNNFDTKKSSYYGGVFVPTELDVKEPVKQ